MKLCTRDVFRKNGVRHRLLDFNKQQRWCWIISMEDHNAWPVRVDVAEIETVEREVSTGLVQMTPSIAQQLKVEEDYKLLQRVMETNMDLFNHAERRLRLELCALELGCTSRTLQKLLRRFWQRGLTKSALLPDFNNCGRREGDSTAGRGRKPRKSNRQVYQITAADVPKIEQAIKYLFDDDRRSIKNAYQWLRNTFYVGVDGNGEKFLLPHGECPTSRQFIYAYYKRYPLEVRLEKRKGNREYTKTYKPKLSDTIADCLGVGHRYEIDATIADVRIVHSTDRETIIGKATLYLIVDRKSRLIVGFYLCLDAPSWETAVEAVVSLVESKQVLCERYGVKYDPADWPADGFLPAEFLGDRGEMISHNSSRLTDHLGVAVANTRACVPNQKPNVETRFELITTDLRSFAPGYDPPEGLGKRRTKHYEKEVCLTLDELAAEILEAIIAHNRRPLTRYNSSANEIMRGVEPSPIELWKDGLTQTGNLGHHSTAETVRLALLPTAKATLTNNGLLFKKLYFESRDARLLRAFTKARDGRDSITVSYDRRSVDLVYVHLPDGIVMATLSARNQSFRGLSFREAEIVRDKETMQEPELDQKRAEVTFASHERRKARIRAAEKLRDEFGNLSVAHRKANAAAARAAEKRQENIDRAARQAEAVGVPTRTVATATASISGLPLSTNTDLSETRPLTPAQSLRRKMA